MRRVFFSVLLLMVFGAVAHAQDFEVVGDLVCSSLTDCTSEASCGSPGRPAGCLITCENGASVSCPAKTTKLARFTSPSCLDCPKTLEWRIDRIEQVKELCAAADRWSKLDLNRSELLSKLAEGMQNRFLTAELVLGRY